MDTLTHALSGALLARATAPGTPRPSPNGEKPLATWARVGIGALAAAFPDGDFVMRLFGTLPYLESHRGVTHSIVMLPVWALSLAVIFMLLSRGRHHWREFVGVCAMGIGIHIAGDVITSFGTMILAPISYARFSYPTTFIIDPIFTGIIVLGLIGAALWRSRGRAVATVGLVALAGYVGFQAVLHERAVAVGQRYAQAHGLANARSEALPQPLSPFNWKVVVRDGDRYHVAYVDLAADRAPSAPPHDAGLLARVAALYRPPGQLRWQVRRRWGEGGAQSALAEQAWSGFPPGLKRFMEYPALYEVDQRSIGTCAWFFDLRFSLDGIRSPFRFGTCQAEEGAPWRLYRLVGDRAEALSPKN